MKQNLIFTGILTGIFIVLLLVPEARAQDVKVGAKDSRSRCLVIENTAPYSVMGSVYTNYYKAESKEHGSVVSRDTENFRLKAGDRVRICSHGPYYGRNKDLLYLQLKTLVPIFECYTKVEEIVTVHGRRKTGGGTESWADCKS